MNIPIWILFLLDYCGPFRWLAAKVRFSFMQHYIARYMLLQRESATCYWAIFYARLSKRMGMDEIVVPPCPVPTPEIVENSAEFILVYVAPELMQLSLYTLFPDLGDIRHYGRSEFQLAYAETRLRHDPETFGWQWVERARTSCSDLVRSEANELDSSLSIYGYWILTIVLYLIADPETKHRFFLDKSSPLLLLGTTLVETDGDEPTVVTFSERGHSPSFVLKLLRECSRDELEVHIAIAADGED